MDVVQGRAFSKVLQSDAESVVMINEAAMHVPGWDAPTGKAVKSDRMFGLASFTAEQRIKATGI